MDALNFSIAIDNYLARMWYALAPHKNLFELNSPREIAGNISIPKNVVGTFSNWLASSAGYDFTPEQMAAFDALPSA